MTSTVLVLAIFAALCLWLFVLALRTGRADGLAFAKSDTREAQPLIFWSYTALMGGFFIGSLWMLVGLFYGR